MSDYPLNITALNDFIFCPISIYFHSLYDGVERKMFQCSDQIGGTAAHQAVDQASYSAPGFLRGLEVYSDELNLVGKIDLYDEKSQALIERKKKVKTIYDGYIYQLYAQCYAMREMGYTVSQLVIHSMDDNKNYAIPLPEENESLLEEFFKVRREIEAFDFFSFRQENSEKCRHCIYEPYCDRGIIYAE